MTTHINARFLTQPFSGVQRYALEVLTALDRMWEPTSMGPIVAYVPKAARLRTTPEWSTIQLRALPGPRGHVWEQTSLLRATRRGPLLSLCNAGPVFHPRHIVALHDAHVFDFPDGFSARYRALHYRLRPALARRAHKLITVSPHAAERLAAHVARPASDFHIVPNAADHLHAVRPDPSVLHSHHLAARGYLLAVGNLAPVKNLTRLVAAHRGLAADALPLVLVGGAADGLAASETLQGARVIPVGRISDAQLRALIESAAAFVFPSLSEGFGIPPLEAMTLGTPVFASHAGAMPWVLGQAAQYFDPHDMSDIARALTKASSLTCEENTRMVRAGRTRADHFSWAHSAQTLLDLLDVNVGHEREAA